VTAATLVPTLDLSGTAPIPFLRLVRVELRKSYDTRASLWLLASIALLVTLAEGIALAVTVSQDQPLSYGDTAQIAGVMTSFLLPVLGIMLVTSEWGQRTGMVTFALEPRRPLVLAAKAVVGVLLTLATVAMVLAVGLVAILLYSLLQGTDVVWGIAVSEVVAFTVTQILSMLGGFALAALLLNTAAAIVTFYVYLFVLPALFGIGSELMDWFADLAVWLDFRRAQEPLFEWPLTGAEWSHLVVSGAIWLVIPLVAGIWRILRAEVK
jgi:ABC-2 type transport system permease protein